MAVTPAAGEEPVLEAAAMPVVGLAVTATDVIVAGAEAADEAKDAAIEDRAGAGAEPEADADADALAAVEVGFESESEPESELEAGAEAEADAEGWVPELPLPLPPAMTAGPGISYEVKTG